MPRPTCLELTFGLLLAVAAAPATVANAQSSRSDRDEAVAQRHCADALEHWRSRWTNRRFDPHELARADGKTDAWYGKDNLPPYQPARLTHLEALDLLLERAVELQGVAVTRAVLLLGATGLDGRELDLDRSPGRIQASCRAALGRFTDGRSLLLLQSTAAGDLAPFARNDVHVGIVCAALHALGDTRRGVFRPTLQRALGHEHRLVRLSAAEALHAQNERRSLPKLLARLAIEPDPLVGRAVVVGISSIVQANLERLGDRERRETLEALLARLATLDWRTDLAILDFVAELRNRASIPPLIELLERYGDRSTPASRRPRGRRRDDTADELLSGRVARRAHAILTDLTGALVPVDDPAAWRAFWDREEKTFQLAPVRDATPGTTHSGFFGVPVEGSRVVFVIDTSGSMDWVFRPSGDNRPAEELPRRIDKAKRELWKAVQALAPDARFNVVSFATRVRTWRDRLIDATPDGKESVRSHVVKLQPNGATNVYGALQKALGIRTAAFGARYDVPVDELFLLSDGEPTEGEIQDPDRILDVIRETNRYSNVRIHTVFMGMGRPRNADPGLPTEPTVAEDFMRRLAEENGGRYVRL